MGANGDIVIVCSFTGDILFGGSSSGKCPFYYRASIIKSKCLKLHMHRYTYTHTHTSSRRCTYHMEEYSVFFDLDVQLVISDVVVAIYQQMSAFCW